MSCCASLIVTFGLVASTSIPYGESEVAQYGQKPNVQVYYSQDGQFVLSEDMSAVTFTGTSIEVDHGGINSGIVKVF